MSALHDAVRRLAREHNAVILAHSYQVAEVQDVADFVGDSLGLAIEARKTDASVIVMCGVYFMAETAKIVNPERTVLSPDPTAGCSLADSITLRDLRRWKAEYPGAVVVSYVNTTAAIKAESDFCVTSGNAEAVVRSIPEEREILFETFRVWQETDASVGAAAERLCCHPNTVRYRLRRIEKRTGRSLSRPRDVAELCLAFEVNRRLI